MDIHFQLDCEDSKQERYNGISIMLLNTFKTCLSNIFLSSLDELEIKNKILIEMPKWRTQGFILNCDVEELISLIDQLAGGSRFFSEETAIRVEDACMEIEEIINCLGS